MPNHGHSSRQHQARQQPDDAHKHLLYCTLTANSFTLCTYENGTVREALLPDARPANCVDIVTSQLASINDPNAFSIGIIPVASITNLSDSTRRAVKGTGVTLYYIKYQFDNSSDLVTLLAICSSKLKKEIPLTVLDHVLARYKDFKAGRARNTGYGSVASPAENSAESAEGSDFKSIFLETVQQEEKNIALIPAHLVLLATPKHSDGGASAAVAAASSSKDKRALLAGASSSRDLSAEAQQDFDNQDLTNLNINFMTSELNDLKQIMNDNVDKIMERNERIGLLVNKTDKINMNSQAFKRRTVLLKRRLWWNNVRFQSLIVLLILFVAYFTVGELGCGLPFYSKCFSRHKGAGDDD